MGKKRKWFLIVVLAILGIPLFMAIGGGSVMLLWNWLLPTLFGWPRITFWQALGLLALCRILFGGLGRHGSSRSHRRKGRRWERMTPEERERLRQSMSGRSGLDSSPS